MKIFKQLIKEFWIPLTIAVIWTLINFSKLDTKPKSWTDFVNIAMPTFFFISWLTSQYFRVKKQENVSSTLSKIETRVESVLSDISKQAQNMKIISDRQLYQTFDICLDQVRESREELADTNRQLITTKIIAVEKFSLRRENPFYQSRRYLNLLVNYALYTFKFEIDEQLLQRYNRTSYHSEELIGVITSLINQLNHQSINWKTPKSVEILKDITKNLQQVKSEILPKTKYHKEHYKGSDLNMVMERHIDDLKKLTD